MGLRINTNVAAVGAIRNLRQNDGMLQKSLERLSTGLRINSASDDPSGLVISEQLRSQIASMNQALENSQNASNLIGTAEAALAEVSDLLVSIRESVIFALNTGGSDSEQIDAEQDSIDNAIRSIDRISQTTKFASRKLLDGSSGIQLVNQSASITELDIQNATFDGQSQQVYTVNLTQSAQQAQLFTSTNAYAQAATQAQVRLTGNEGTQDIFVALSATTTQFDNAVNIYTEDTGVYASGGALYSVEFGSAESISVEVISGTLNAGGGLTSTSGIQFDMGQDLDGNLNGINFDADGNEIRIVSDVITGDIRIGDNTALGSYTFTLKNSGLVFQLNQNEGSQDREQVGISSVNSSQLGARERTVNSITTAAGAPATTTVGGFLSSLVSGGLNDLNSNASNALRIVDLAIEEISDRRAYLGAFQAQTVDTNIRSLSVAVENLTASESAIRDLDFAQESADFTRNQILYQSGISVLAQSNLISQSVLSLLG